MFETFLKFLRPVSMGPGSAFAYAHWAGTTPDYVLFLRDFFLATFFAAFFAFGRLRNAARCAAASAAPAHTLSSSESSNSRAGSCQYELTVTVLARVWYENGVEPSASNCGVVCSSARKYKPDRSASAKLVPSADMPKPENIGRIVTGPKSENRSIRKSRSI